MDFDYSITEIQCLKQSYTENNFYISQVAVPGQTQPFYIKMVYLGTCVLQFHNEKELMAA